MTALAVILIALLAGIALANGAGWWIYARPLGNPWNWRALVWHSTYFAWLEDSLSEEASLTAWIEELRKSDG